MKLLSACELERKTCRDVMEGESEMGFNRPVACESLREVPVSVWLACSNACAKSCTLTYRSSGFLDRALSTTLSTASGSEGSFSRKGGGGTDAC